MKIKTIGTIAFLLVGIAVGPTMAVSTISLSPSATSGGPEYRNIGGELWAHIVKGSLGGYGEEDSFVSFCVEMEEPLDFDSPALDAVINPAGAIEGGIGGSPDPIHDYTAWLFEQFHNRTLPYYEFDGSVNGGVDRTASAITLQYVIWGLEDELGMPEGAYFEAGMDSALDPDQQQYFDLAKAAVDPEGGGGWTNNGQIQVVNVYAEGTYGTENPVYKQDILIRIPAPGAIWLGMAGIGLVGWIRRCRMM